MENFELDESREQKSDQMAKTAIQMLETLRLYTDEAVTYNILQSKTGVRLTAAIDYLIVAYINIIDYQSATKTCFPFVGDLEISLADLYKIKDMAKPVELQNTDIKIRRFIDIARAMLTKFLKTAIEKGQKELLKEDVDKLLNAIAKVDELIDGAQ